MSTKWARLSGTLRMVCLGKGCSMNLSIYATLFRLTPFGKSSIVSALRSNAKALLPKNSRGAVDEACAQLVAAGFFSMDLHQFPVAAAIADQLATVLAWYTENNGTTAQKARAHGNMLLLRTAVRVFESNVEALGSDYENLQRDLSLVIVESSQYGKRWRMARTLASQLQLYLDWRVLGPDHPQTLRTAETLVESETIESLASARNRWFEHAQPGWTTFLDRVAARFAPAEIVTTGL